jgi:hypothetical protein
MVLSYKVNGWIGQVMNSKFKSHVSYVIECAQLIMCLSKIQLYGM